MECAGNGRARSQPRPLSQPWLLRGDRHGRVDGHVRWRASWPRPGVRATTRSRSSSPAPTVASRAGRSRTTRAACALADGSRPEVLLAYEMNGAPARAAARLSAAAARAGLVRHDQRQVADLDRGRRPSRSTATSRRARTCSRRTPTTRATPVRRMRVRGPDGPARHPRLLQPAAPRRCRAGRGSSAAPWSGQSPVAAVEFGVDGKWQPAKLEAPLGEFAWRAWSAQWQAVDRRARADRPSHRRRGQRPAHRSALELPGHGQQPRPTGASQRQMTDQTQSSAGTTTLLFTDIEGSTKLLQQLGDRYALALADHHRLLREAFTSNGGVELDSAGDGLYYKFLECSLRRRGGRRRPARVDRSPVAGRRPGSRAHGPAHRRADRVRGRAGRHRRAPRVAHLRAPGTAARSCCRGPRAIWPAANCRPASR